MVVKWMTETLKFVYFFQLWIYLSAALMERFLTWESHLRNSSQAGDDNQVTKFSSLATYPPAIQGTY